MGDRADPAADSEHEELALAVIRGLFGGDLEPLVAYLRSEFPVHRVVRTELADYLEGAEGLPRIQWRGTRDHQKLRTSARDHLIDVFVRGYERDNGPNREAAVHAAAEAFHVSERTVWEALRSTA